MILLRHVSGMSCAMALPIFCTRSSLQHISWKYGISQHISAFERSLKVLWCGCRVSTTVSQTFLALAGARHKLKVSRASTNILAVNNHVLEGLLLLSAGNFSFLLRLPEIRAHSSCIMLHQEEPEASVELLEFFCFLLFGNLRAHFIQKREIQTLHQVRVLQVTSGVVGMTQKKDAISC